MLRRTLLYISGSSLRILIFFGVSIACFSLIVTNPKHIKNVVSDTGIYDNFTAAVIEDTVSNQDSGSLPIQNNDVQNIIKNGFSPKSLQSNTENVIDGAYRWLEGETSTPNFKADFTKERKQVADDIANYAFSRLSTLPTCFAVPETFDPFTAGCQPPFTDMPQEEANLSANIAGAEGILPKATYDMKDLPKDVNGQYLYERYTYAPSVYLGLRLSPLIVGILFLISSTCIVLLSRNKRIGFQTLGIAILTSAGALILTPILFSFVIPNMTNSLQFTTQDTSKAQHLLDEVVTSITNDFYVLLINIALQLVLLGTIILLAEKFTRPSSKYSEIQKRSGVISGYTKKPSSTKKHKYKPSVVPVQSSEESKRHRPKRTKNKKYRRIPKKEI